MIRLTAARGAVAMLLPALAACAGGTNTTGTDVAGQYAAIEFPPPPPPPPTGGSEGCSPGYWKNHAFPAGYSKDQLFSSIFENAFPGKTLQQVLSAGGGGLTALGRATVSAYFNAATVSYELSTADVVNAFNGAFPGSTGSYNSLKDQFEALQDVGGRPCPNPTGK